MVFSLYSSIDVNSSTDPYSADGCIWFTLFLGQSEMENPEDIDKPIRKYEYICFPSTAKGPEDIHHISMDYPYYHNYRYEV